jgi:hypothetical protein
MGNGRDRKAGGTGGAKTLHPQRTDASIGAAFGKLVVNSDS